MTTVPDPLHTRVAQIALSVAQQHGFALGGGQALLAHGLVERPTEDIDLFTDTEGAVRVATDLVRSALIDEGFEVNGAPGPNDLVEVVYGMDDAFAELRVTDGKTAVSISLAQLARHRAPVVMTVGPVLHLHDLLGSKASALATRFEVRDYIDVSAALGRGYEYARLVEMAREHDPGLTEEDFVDAMRRLDTVPDAAFARYGLSIADVTALRERFADWPR